MFTINNSNIKKTEFEQSLSLLNTNITEVEKHKLKIIQRNWDFYEGYHWQDMPPSEGKEITVNYCRTFVDKYVAFELGKGFTYNISKAMEKKNVLVGYDDEIEDIENEDGENTEDKEETTEQKTLFEFLNDVWEDNNQFVFSTELGQQKSITGECWIQVELQKKDSLLKSASEDNKRKKEDSFDYTVNEAIDTFNDPFNEFPKGRIAIKIVPTQYVFPVYDEFDKGVISELVIMYTVKQKHKTITGSILENETLFKQSWTRETVTTTIGEEVSKIPNPYKVIPFVQINNLPLSGRNEGRGDLDDLIPLNIEYNMKLSNVSEIIDYHASPITLVYGAKINSLEKGPNKIWGGLSSEAKVENLELSSDLSSSTNYISSLKQQMCEIGGIPETILGGAQSISNTSGVALQFMNMPIIEKTRIKSLNTQNGLKEVNKLIIYIAETQNIIRKPKGVSNKDFYNTEVQVPDTLPKDYMIELQLLQQELKLGLDTRENAMKRLGKEDIPELIKKVDEGIEKHGYLFGINIQEDNTEGDNNTFKNTNRKKQQTINSGMMNGETPIEQLRKEETGANGLPKED